jgi:hypothetical protein
MVAVNVEATGVVPMLNVAELEPAGIVTVAGTVAFPELEVNVTTLPAGPAGPLSVAVPVDGLPPATDDGETVTLVRAAEATVRLAVCVVEPNVAEIVAVTGIDTAVVLMVNVAEDEPVATVTEVGNVALVLLDDRLTTVPPGPAFPVNFTVPVDELPPTTMLGKRTTLERVAGVTDRVAVWD